MASLVRSMKAKPVSAFSNQKMISARERTLMPRNTPEKYRTEGVICLTKPGSHVDQDFNGGPLQASFVL